MSCGSPDLDQCSPRACRAMLLSMNTHDIPFAIPRVLAAAPHRLLFLIGALNVLAAMGWWLHWLHAPSASPIAHLPANWMHGFILQYQVLPSFIFGFLTTVFPRWMNLPEASAWHYLPIGLGLFGGQLFCLAGLTLHSAILLHGGLLMTLAGWLSATVWLTIQYSRAIGWHWHAASCLLALYVGVVGVVSMLLYVHWPKPGLAFAMLKIGSFGLLLPIYSTVAHRMFPFFAANVVLGYRAWRPLWLLAVQWPLWLVHLSLELQHAHAWLWLVDLPLCVLNTYMLWRWWPRGNAPALLRVLFIGYAWLPLAMALYATQSLWFAIHDVFLLGRAPVHALSIGFFGSLLVAMVTRVTQGHSGRPLQLGRAAVWAFVLMQVVCLLRLVAEILPDALLWQRLAAWAWLMAFAPWVIRNAGIYLRPRADGRNG
jgi:uncharacterized protein involved in response to NO